MSSFTTKRTLDEAMSLALSQQDQLTAKLIEGLIDMNKSLHNELSDLRRKLDNIESKVSSLR